STPQGRPPESPLHKGGRNACASTYSHSPPLVKGGFGGVVRARRTSRHPHSRDQQPSKGTSRQPLIHPTSKSPSQPPIQKRVCQCCSRSTNFASSSLTNASVPLM